MLVSSFYFFPPPTPSRGGYTGSFTTFFHLIDLQPPIHNFLIEEAFDVEDDGA